MHKGDPIPVFVGVEPPTAWDDIEDRRQQFGDDAAPSLRDARRPELATRQLDWEDQELDPRWIGDDTADCVAALNPSIFHRHGADEYRRFCVGAAAREEVAVVICTVGDDDREDPEVWSVFPASSHVSVSEWGLCCVDGSQGGGEGGSVNRTRRPGPPVRMPSGFTGFRFPPEVILLAVRWYLRYGLSYWDLEELLAERGIGVDHVTLYRWVQRFTPLLIDAARPCRHVAGDRWFVDETYVKVAGVWSYVYRAVDQHGQVIDVYVSQRRDIASARTFFTAALTVHGHPDEVVTDRAPALAHVIEELLPAALHNIGQYENNGVECDHGRLKARLRPMRGLKTNRTATVVIRGHAFIQNLRRGHYELAVDSAPPFRLAGAFDELRPAI